jgi:PIN domain nuclease of toxin-antitoxin system
VGEAVRLLLDTHTLLWALEGGQRLSQRAREEILKLENEVLVSIASAWEMAIKKSLGKLESPSNLEEVVQDAGFVTRMVTFSDCECLSSLPRHHRDPFDRMLVAQATVDGIPIVTCDEQIAQYRIQTIW